jgi:hypothetical protein
MLLEEHLAALRAKIEELIKPPLTFGEAYEVVKEVIAAVTDEVKQLSADGPITHEKVEALLMETWAWADGEFKIVDLADAALKWPGLLTPVELFDGPAIRMIIEKIILPQAAALIVHPK